MKFLHSLQPLRLLRFFLVLLCATAGAIHPAFANDDESVPGNPPKLHPGIITCEDGSRWHGFTFEARLGLGYLIESSTDLQEWEPVETFAGVNHQQTFLMKEIPVAVPIPTTGPPAPGPVLKNAMVIMRPAASGGGIVLSWLSLDDHQPMTWHLPALTPVSGWSTTPIYARAFDGFYFFITHPHIDIEPPAENPEAGPLDTAMLAAFRAHFSDMNADITAAIVRNQSQTFTPPTAGDRRFWRVRCNWSLDSDGDGTPDWMEYAQLFAAAAGTNTVAGPAPDPFNADANNDGIADGAQRTSDGDTIADDEDADKTDGSINWKKTPEARYALFRLYPPDTPPTSTSLPIQVNDLGDVLFPDFVWSGGGSRRWAVETLANGTAVTEMKVTHAHGLFLDDSGIAYTAGTVVFPTDVAGDDPTCLVSYDHLGANPKLLSTLVNDGTANIPVCAGAFSSPTAPDMHSGVSASTAGYWSRYILAPTVRPVNITLSPVRWGLVNFQNESRQLWTLKDESSTNTRNAVRGDTVLDHQYGFGPTGQRWGHQPGHAGAYLDDDELPAPYERCVLTPAGRPLALSSTQRPKDYYEVAGQTERWHDIRSFTKDDPVIDFSRRLGAAFLKSGKIWQNGTTRSFRDTAPRFSPFFKGNVFGIQDATPRGFILASQTRPSQTAPVHYLGVPIEVEGPLPGDPYTYRGVDTLSLTARKTQLGLGDATWTQPETFPSVEPTTVDSNGWQDRVWIMAPTDPPIGAETVATIAIPQMESGTILKIKPTSDRIQIDESEIASGTSRVVNFKATTGPSLDAGLQFQISKEGDTTAGQNSATTPIGVKVMKKRTVKLRVHPMVLHQPGVADNGPDLLPSTTQGERDASKAMLEEYLNLVYGKQVNTYFAVEIVAPTLADYDAGGTDDKGDGKIVYGQPDFAAAMPNYAAFEANIDVWVTGGVMVMLPKGEGEGQSRVAGYTMKFSGTGSNNGCDPRCIIDGDMYENKDPLHRRLYFLNTVAHEIGHVMIGQGHPDETESAFDSIVTGPSPLNGTNKKARLMGSATNLFPDGQNLNASELLVKREWDEIEKWLKKQETDGHL